MDLERDMENFVRDYGTGNQIPDPITFVNYNSPDAIPSSSARTSSHPARFNRISRRERRHMNHAPPEEEEEPMTNVAGVGAGRSPQPVERQLTRQPSRGRSDHPKTNGYINGNTASSSPSGSVAPSPSSPQHQFRKSSQYNRDPLAEPIDHNAEPFIKVGSNVYKVDLNRDPQRSPTRPGPSPSSASSMAKGGGIDPLAQQLQDLNNAVSSSGSIRRSNSKYRSGDSSAGPSRRGTLDSLAAPGGSSAAARSPSPARDYRSSAEVVVGGVYPSSTSAAASRPASPNPPTAAFMVPKPSVSPGSQVIEAVVSDYHQSLPGERKSISRGSYVGASPTAEQQRHQSGGSISRPSSQLGHAGIGAHGSRSNSPQPPSRGPSPGPGSLISIPQSDIGRNGSISARATSPNSVGIALDPSGRVSHDEMAQRYQQVQQIQPQQRPPSVHHQPQYQPQQRRTSFVAPAPPPTVPVPGPPPAIYGTPSPYQQPPPPQTYSHVPAPGPQPSYNPPPPPQTPHYQPRQPVYQQPPYVNGVQRGPSVSNSYYGGMNGMIQQPPPVTAPPPAPVQQPPPPPQVVQQPPVQTMQYQQPNQQRSNPNLHPHRTSMEYHSASAGRRSPSPQPPLSTGQVTEDGTPILFYGLSFFCTWYLHSLMC